MITFFIYTERSRPPFYLVTTFVWGPDHNFDSDGNSRTPHDTEWTELYCTNRSSPFERFNVEVSKEPRTRIEITSADDSAASKVALYLMQALGEQVVEVMGDGREVPMEQQVLLSRCGDDFDLDVRAREVRDVQKSRLALLRDQTHE